MREVIALLIAAPLLLVVLHSALNRWSKIHPHRTPFTAGFYCNVLVLPAYLALHWTQLNRDPVDLICGLLFVAIYLNCCVFLNWFIFTLTDVSMHIQLMMQLHKRGTASIADLESAYNKDVIVGNRIPRLIELGQLRLENGRLFVTGGSVLLGAWVVALLRRLLGIPVRPELADHG
jgi:hypothetical protein